MASSSQSRSLAEPLFEAQGVGKRFGDQVVLKSASFWVKRSQITALLGRNGSGKTTLIKAALGEIRMDHGFVRFRGTSYERPRLWRLARRGLRYLDQEARLPASRTLGAVMDQVGASCRADPTQWIEALDLTDLLDARVPELSRGERKRAALATALIPSPYCLVLDEPFEGIEPQDQELLAACLRSLVSEGVGVVLTGHDVEIILKTVTNVVWCTSGTTHDLGTVAEATKNTQFVREYLGPGRHSAPLS